MSLQPPARLETARWACLRARSVCPREGLAFVLLAILFVGGLMPICVSDAVRADGSAAPATLPTLASRIEAIRLGEPVRLDGILDEAVWQRPSAAPLVQNEPDNGVPPRMATDWWVAYDNEAIYVAARMHDAAPESITCNLGRRDAQPNSDWLYINFDTFNDDRTGYTFALSPSGVQCDGVLYNDGWNDNAWDGVWDYGVKIDEQGWAAEVRIPFSQLNFPDRDEQVWGINLSRRIRRLRERDDAIHLPRGEAGYIRRFPDLVGISGIKSSHPLEVLAYAASKGEFLDVAADDPFHDAADFEGSAGADLKWGMASNLMLNATINPDFGQVEVDPAVVNLSDFETFFPERRPFFVKDANKFDYAEEGTDSNWNFNWSDPQVFYSRRIGRAPSLSLADYDYADVPGTTTILGAGKLSGTVGSTALGVLSAVTSEEHADLELDGKRSQQVVEPLANYTVARLKRASSDGRNGIGLMTTGVWRDLSDSLSRAELTRRAFSGGIDGWTRLDNAAVWAVRGYASASNVAGDPEAIDAIQRSSRHYYYRPGADHLDYDPERTSLSGWTGRMMLNKESGRLRLNTALGTASPGYEINDLGYQGRADLVNYHLATGWRWLDPGKVFQFASVDLAGYRSWDYGGHPDEVGAGFFYNATLTNWWSFWGNIFYNPEHTGLRYTRGGPAMEVPERVEVEGYVDSDGRKSVYGMVGGGFSTADDGSRSANGEVFLRINARSSVELSFSPEISWSFDSWQWVDNVEDPEMTATSGTRCIFADLEYRTCSLTTRVDWTFTPKFTLQTYIQPLLASGDYSDLKELAQPGSFAFDHYGEDNGSTIVYDSEDEQYAIDPDGATGPAAEFTLSDPDFNFKSLKVNMILRWEYRPGSTLYFVWTQNRTNEENPGDFDVSRDAQSLFDAHSENVFMVKATYWFDI
jgi:hypothetical protein